MRKRREDRTSYIIRKTREAREEQANEVREARESCMLINSISETEVVKKNIRDLQFQLQESYKRQKTFTDELYKLRRKVDRLGGDSRQGEFDI